MTSVLVIDDDVAVAELMRVVLEDAGYTVTLATSMNELRAGPFDRIVTDLLTVTRYTYEEARDYLLQIADRYPRVPVIVVTAHGEAQRDAEALRARRVLMKPFDVDQLVAAVRDDIVTS